MGIKRGYIGTLWGLSRDFGGISREAPGREGLSSGYQGMNEKMDTSLRVL